MTGGFKALATVAVVAAFSGFAGAAGAVLVFHDSLRGPMGARGPQGEEGPIGPQGPSLTAPDVTKALAEDRTWLNRLSSVVSDMGTKLDSVAATGQQASSPLPCIPTKVVTGISPGIRFPNGEVGDPVISYSTLCVPQ